MYLFNLFSKITCIYFIYFVERESKKKKKERKSDIENVNVNYYLTFSWIKIYNVFLFNSLFNLIEFL